MGKRIILLQSLTAISIMSGSIDAQTRDDYCGVEPSALLQAAGGSHTGRYVNAAYGYSVSIPKGLLAFTSVGGPERGFTILLSRRPRAFLRVDASYDAFYDITPAGVHHRDLNTIRLHDAVLADHAFESSLAAEPALRATVRLQCRGDSDVQVHEELITVRAREIYRLDLQTTPDRWESDQRALNALLKSWRWETVR